MGNKQKIFQFALIGLFGLLTVGGLAMLALFEPGKKQEEVIVQSDTIIWGPPLPGEGIHFMLRNLPEGSPLKRTKYIEKHPETFYVELIEAIATNRGPDAVIIDANMLLPLLDKLQVMPYQSFPLLTYQNMFIDGADIYAMEKGIYAYPLLIDPIVLYWNRDLFSNAGVVKVPQDWETFVTDVPKLTVLTEDADIVQSAIAFGEYQNVLNAKEILSALLMQTGSRIVVKRRNFVSDLTDNDKESNPYLALQFYTDFSNPVKNVYSWNKTLDRSREAFAANKVAMYAGFLSEKQAIELLNPNLNYGIAVWPQPIRATNRATYGRMYGIAVLKTSRDPVAAYMVANAFITPENSTTLSKATAMPSPQRNLLVEPPTDPFMSVGVQSARIARTWLDPDPVQVDRMIQRSIEDVVAGQMSVQKAISTLKEDLDAALSRYPTY